MEEKNDEHVKSETRNRIFKTAAELFSRDGYYKVSVREICEASGVTKPVLYYYFKDKDALLYALVEETKRINSFLKEKYFRRESGFLTQLRSTPLMYADFLKNYKHFMNFGAFLHFSDVPAEIQKILDDEEEKNMKEIVELFTRGIREGYFEEEDSAWNLAMSFFGPISFIVFHFVRRGASLERTFDELNGIVEHWIKHHIKQDIINGDEHE